MSTRSRTLGCVVLATALAGSVAYGDGTKDLLKQANAAWTAGQSEKALDLVSQAMEQNPNDKELPFLRGRMHDALRHFDAAVKDLSACLKIDPNFAPAYDLRGSAEFKRGHVDEAVRDFDGFLSRSPAGERDKHWRRGIALYYARRYEDARDQFRAYAKVDSSDVENAAWDFLCNVKIMGVTKARRVMLPAGPDSRMPMAAIYELYLGKIAKPDDILKVVKPGGQPETDSERADRLFYAHLYIGLLYDVNGETNRALDHLTQAAGKYRSPHYMGEVARVHADMLKAVVDKKK